MAIYIKNEVESLISTTVVSRYETILEENCLPLCVSEIMSHLQAWHSAVRNRPFQGC